MAAMKMLMGPALALMNKLTTPQKMLASALAFTLPVGIVVYALIVSGVAWQDPAANPIAAIRHFKATAR